MAEPSSKRKYLPEANILKPADSSLEPDDWPSFFLNDAAVYRSDGTTLVNALLVGEEGPFIVRGKLDREDEDTRAYFLRHDLPSTYIEIEASMLYSLGYDPLPLVWVSGHAGWFMISPSEAYKPIYTDICDITVLYYQILEVYDNAVGKAAKTEKRNIYATLDHKDILLQYGYGIGDGVTYDEMVQNCARLGPLLLAHCLRTNEIPWKTTAFYKWLVRQIHERERRDRLASRTASIAPSSPPVTESPIPPPQLPSSALSHDLPLRTTQLPAGPVAMDTDTTDTTDTVDPSSAPDSDLRAKVFRLLLDAILEIAREVDDVSRINQSQFHTKLYNKCRLKHYVAGKDLSAYFHAELLRTLDPNTWGHSPYADFLRHIAATEDTFHSTAPGWTLADMPNQLVRRNVQATTRLQQQQQQQQRSSTGPGASSLAGLPPVITAGQRGGKRAGLRLPLASQKRPYSSTVDGDSESSTPGAPSARRPRLDRSVLDDSSDGSSSDDGRPVATTSPAPDTAIVLRAEPVMQSTAPSGPNRTWHCSQPGCDFFVRDAGPNFDGGGGDDDSDDDDDDDDDNGHDEDRDQVRIAQEFVRQHIRSHEQEKFNRVDLAIAEGSQGHLSVSHLLEKIRSMGESSRTSTDEPAALPNNNGMAAPNPIVRRFLV